jgi:hypothetical protein
MPQNASEIKHLPAPRDGAVTITVETTVTEREVVDERADIIAKLDSAYLNLLEEMKEFQFLWDANPVLALVISKFEGQKAGGNEWVDDQLEMFHLKYWTEVGEQLKDAASTGYDRLATYSKQRFEQIQTKLTKDINEVSDNIDNWAWWQVVIERNAKDLVDKPQQVRRSAASTLAHIDKEAKEFVEKARKIYKHRNAILNFPTLIADREPGPIEAFVDNVLMDIDPPFAKAIKTNPEFGYVLAVIDDDESALSYLAYVGLMLEAIPPNFYFYVYGKAGAYLMLEAVLLMAGTLLTGGTATAGRVAMLIARITSMSAKVAKITRRVKRAKAAIESFIRILEDLLDVAKDLRRLGEKLVQVRSKNLRLKGQTKSTINAKKASIKRDKKCRLCGSTTHSTPRSRRGVVDYE